MFKLGFKSRGEREDVIGHDRFCQQRNSSIAKYRKRRHYVAKKAVCEAEAFELVTSQVAGQASTSVVSASGTNLCRSLNEIHWSIDAKATGEDYCLGQDDDCDEADNNGDDRDDRLAHQQRRDRENNVTISCASSSTRRDRGAGHSRDTGKDEVDLNDNDGSDQGQQIVVNHRQSVKKNRIWRKATKNDNNDNNYGPSSSSSSSVTLSSWESISRFLTSLATTITCHHFPKDPSKIALIPGNQSNHLQRTNIVEEDDDEAGFGFVDDHHDTGTTSTLDSVHLLQGHEKFPFPAPSNRLSMVLSKANVACLLYLKRNSHRFTLHHHLPRLGWRDNRLWCVVTDSGVRAERLMSVTAYNRDRAVLCDTYSKLEMTHLCRSLQHPYVCPLLDVEVMDMSFENVDSDAQRQGQLESSQSQQNLFAVAVTPITSRGSLRDLFQKSSWGDGWKKKRSVGQGLPLSQVQAQRLSCHVLVALLELRMKGLPAGIGAHLHPGNVLIQHGTARFAALDNILLGHPCRLLPFISRHLDKNPEAVDSIAFAFILFAMCTGYEVMSAKLSPQNWNDVQNHAHIYQVLKFILQNPEKRIPTLTEIVQLDFYKNVDLRELTRAMPLPQVVSGPPFPSLQILRDHFSSGGPSSLSKPFLNQGMKCRSVSAMCDILVTDSPVNRNSSNSTSNDNVALRPTQVLSYRGLLRKQLSSSTPCLTCDHPVSQEPNQTLQQLLQQDVNRGSSRENIVVEEEEEEEEEDEARSDNNDNDNEDDGQQSDNANCRLAIRFPPEGSISSQMSIYCTPPDSITMTSISTEDGCVGEDDSPSPIPSTPSPTSTTAPPI